MIVIQEKRIVIVGGGFGGIRTALDLSKQKLRNTRITLITNKPHFEYHAALYRVVTGKSPLEVCVPLRDIFEGTNVEIIEDTILTVSLNEKKLEGYSECSYTYDYLVLALGSETAYFNIPGLPHYSYDFKSINSALRLKRHLHEMFMSYDHATASEKDMIAHIVVIGGGASGVELAGELAAYTREMAKHHKVDFKKVHVDLIEAAPRVLPMLSEKMSLEVQARLKRLGVNVFLNRCVMKEEVETVYLKDAEMKTKTVIWTAGIAPHALYKNTLGFQYDKKGRVIVDDYLQAVGNENVFVVGDAASTTFSGMAQTALDNGHVVAEVIGQKIKGKKLKKYIPKTPIYAVPVGPGWAAVLWETIFGKLELYGELGWFKRRRLDYAFFKSILPRGKAHVAFNGGKTLCETCPMCTPNKK